MRFTILGLSAGVLLACTQVTLGSITLVGDPGAVGGPPQQIALDIPGGTMLSDLDEYIIQFADMKHVQWTGEIDIALELALDGGGTITEGETRLTPLDEFGAAIGTPVNATSVDFGIDGRLFEEIQFEVDFATPFHGLRFKPKQSTTNEIRVTTGSLTISFPSGDGEVGDWGQVPEPSTLVVWSILGCTFAAVSARRRRKPNPPWSRRDPASK